MPESKDIRLAARLPDGTEQETDPVTPAEAAEAMQRSPGGAIRAIFDPRTMSAAEIVAQMNSIRRAMRGDDD